jgi:hypothetical protein
MPLAGTMKNPHDPNRLVSQNGIEDQVRVVRHRNPSQVRYPARRLAKFGKLAQGRCDLLDPRDDLGRRARVIVGDA